MQRHIVVARWIVASSCCWYSLSIDAAARADGPAGESTVRNLADPPPQVLSAAAPAERTAPSARKRSPSPEERGANPSPSFPRPGVPSPAFRPPLVEPQVTNQTRQVLGFYGGYAARATLSQLPRRAPLQAGVARPMYRQQPKPFNVVHQEPTVSPYLNLYRDEGGSEGAPNYHAFVRPQLEQIEANRLQHRELQKLRGQMQRMSLGATSAAPASNSARMGVPARYMDTAQFYSGVRR